MLVPKASLVAGVIAAALVGGASLVHSQDAPIEVLHVRGNVSMLAGAGGNIAAQVGDDGVLLVDSGAAPRTEQLIQAIRSLSRRQVTYIVNTTDRADHVGGNARFATTGRPLAIARAAQA